MEHGNYTLEILRSPIPESVATEVVTLLHGFGPHFAASFGVDYFAWLTGVDGGLVAVIARHKENHELAAHAGIIYDSHHPEVGALFNVFTAETHRRRGLSADLVHRVLREHDAIGGTTTVLGTGSPYAARTYQKEGFVHLAGGLETADGPKGYNPDDLGEWIMIRHRPPPFDPEQYFQVAGSLPPRIERVGRHHFPQLVLLFTAETSLAKNTAKLPVLGITDGVLAEEPLVKLMLEIDAGNMDAVVVVSDVPLPLHQIRDDPMATERVLLGVRVLNCVTSAESTYVHPAAEHSCSAALDQFAIDRVEVDSKGLLGLEILQMWSVLLLNGCKSVEIQDYPLPDELLDQRIAIIETTAALPNEVPAGSPSASVVGFVIFSACFEYTSAEQWTSDRQRHCIEEGSEYGWRANCRKFGWVVASIEPHPEPQALPRLQRKERTIFILHPAQKFTFVLDATDPPSS